MGTRCRRGTPRGTTANEGIDVCTISFQPRIAAKFDKVATRNCIRCTCEPALSVAGKKVSRHELAFTTFLLVPCRVPHQITQEMFAPVRSALFNLAGGFAVTSFYIESCGSASNALGSLRSSFDDPRANMPPASRGGFLGWWRGGKVETAHLKNGLSEIDETLVNDTRAFIRQHQVLALFMLCFTVLGGKWPAAVGAGLAVAFDGDDGQERYLRIKDQVLDAIEDFQDRGNHQHDD